jgi:hypothetical protein
VTATRPLGRATLVLAGGLLLVPQAADPGYAQGRFAMIVSGASGGPAYAESYDAWRTAIVLALRDRYGVPERQIHALGERPGASTRLASREQVESAVETIVEQMTPDDWLLVVLIGHGTFDGIDARFNLVGPDLEAREWADLMDRVPGQVILFNTTSASFPFIGRLSRRGHVIVSATDSTAQRYETIFPQAFVEAIGQPEGDQDKDGRLSVWEVFAVASSKVRDWYEQRGRLSTERPVLDDNGDGLGKEAGAPGPDGVVARQLYFDQRATLADSTDPELVELGRQRAELESAIDTLKASRPTLAPDAYQRELERLLIELARVSRRIRDKS